ncbi:peptidoglycan endopeptidase [Deinococcus metallilatus]|uniref:LysM peptidoglycan-binding domain-containing protein n=1 Tax=Deinococcus metallilatus TaxID=1211322 RepID=A0AAJ5JXT3_9DEIO|nr:C40 family peptidase [Deinococcus metallilatus]MBB5296725.1 LysM repeat protein [Deinococcus metallilatus]QBY09198.1 peptidoglycan endopeptidase [Deinococcus metallilatus]RXJ09715.1 peptidoglycan endopeptidase [Deinococcus metallilatus]TLK24181.1 LysM peptidoglycan-binding domain-containing protein [Deinococcus metallilatus]GMA13756.1 peptidase [Deinococcus metallilatus]
MPVFSRTALLLALLTFTGVASRAQAAGNTFDLGGGSLPGSSSVQVAPLTLTVQPGDTAYSLARAHGLSVEALLALNGLSSPDLRVGQVLRVGEVPPYTVQRGDTLYSLARRFGVSVDSLLAANTLPPDAVLEVGQVLRLPGPGLPVRPVVAQSSPAPVPLAASLPSPAQSPVRALPGDWRGTALALLGVPYVYGGSTPSGLDCSGFVLQVFAPLGVQLPRRSADQAQVGLPVSPPELQPGDLVFFDTEGRGQVTHVGIYLGDDQFVNANSYKGQVAVDHLLGDPYWAPRLLGARRVLPANGPVYSVGR